MKILLLILLIPVIGQAQTSEELQRNNAGLMDLIPVRNTTFNSGNAVYARFLRVGHEDSIVLRYYLSSTWDSVYGKPSTFAPSSHTHAESEVTNLVSDLAAKQNTITVLPFANGGITGVTATSATTGTISVPMTSRIITITPTGACTFNATGGVAGQMVTFSVTTSGVTSFTLTFGTNFRKVGTLATGTTSARFFTVTFICLDGTTWTEVGRTAVQS